jgi:chromosome segregation ATPase
MQKLRRFLLLLSVSAFVFALAAYSQDDAPSLGDVARQARLQKQQKDAQAKDAQNKDVQNKDAPAKDAQSKDAQSNDTQGKGTDAAAKDAQALKTPHVTTNDEIPEHVGPTRTSASRSQPSVVTYANSQNQAEYWKSQILARKNYIASLKSDIDSLSASIQYAGGNCVSGCVQWNARQKQKQDQVEAMKAQLEEQEKRLEDLQEAARKQGYGSSVYDP